MAKINLDIAHDCNLGEFLESVEKHNLKISEFIAIGPGGGNPNITFEGSHVNCKNFLIDEMKKRGYNVQKEEFDTDVLDREDLDYLIERVSDLDWPDGRHVYDKLRKLRFG
jgi:hypothetical protein